MWPPSSLGDYKKVQKRTVHVIYMCKKSEEVECASAIKMVR